MLADNKQITERTNVRNRNRSAALGRPGMKLLGEGGLQLVCGRPTLALSSALVPQTLSFSVCVEDSLLTNALPRNIEIRIKTKIKQT